MANVCCVPRCRSWREPLKYGQDPIQKFDFPTDDTLRRAWVQAIRSVDKKCILRKDSSVCLAHFSPSDLLSTDHDDQPHGKCIYRLQPGAVPSMFSDIMEKAISKQIPASSIKAITVTMINKKAYCSTLDPSVLNHHQEPPKASKKKIDIVKKSVKTYSRANKRRMIDDTTLKYVKPSSSARPILNGEDVASNSSGIKIVSVCSAVDNIVIKSEPEEIPCDIPLEHSLDPETPIEEMEGAIIKCEPEEIYCDIKLEPIPQPETIVEEMDGIVDFSFPEPIPSSIFDQKELTEQAIPEFVQDTLFVDLNHDSSSPNSNSNSNQPEDEFPFIICLPGGKLNHQWIEFDPPVQLEIGPKHSTTLCELVLVNSAPIVFKSVVIDFLAGNVSKYIKGVLLEMLDESGENLNPEPFNNLAEINEIIRNFDLIDLCTGIDPNSFDEIQITYVRNGVKCGGIWRSRTCSYWVPPWNHQRLCSECCALEENLESRRKRAFPKSKRCRSRRK